MGKSSPLSARQMTLFFLIWAVIFGLIVRFMPVIRAGFPLNDGGLFLSMARDIKIANYTLPAYTSYNGGHIPLVYPPLSFFLLSLISDISGISSLIILRWLPPLISSLTIPVFFILAKHILQSSTQAGLASIAFALLPNSFLWMIMGGGITRSIGFFMSLLTLYFVHRLYREEKWRYVLFTILTASLLVLSHPEWTIHTFFITLIFWLFGCRKKKSIGYSLLVGMAIILLTSPWWTTVIRQHGLTPFLSASRTGYQNIVNLLPILMLTFANEPYFNIITTLGVMGILVEVSKKRYELLSWLIIPFIIDPRTAGGTAIPPLAIFASIGMTQMVIPALICLRSVKSKWLNELYESDNWITQAWNDKLSKVVLGFFMVYTLLGGFAYSIIVTNIHLSEEHRQAFDWVITNTPIESHFVIISGESPFISPVQEWFPALTQRVSLGTLQGTEWLPGDNFHTSLLTSIDLQTCAYSTVSCLDNWTKQIDSTLDYVYLYQGPIYDLEISNPREVKGMLLSYSLQASPEYQSVYHSTYVTIYKRILSKP